MIVFDFEEALNFEGDSGPYLQYALVRLNSILKKAASRDGRSMAAAGRGRLEILPDGKRSPTGK